MELEVATAEEVAPQAKNNSPAVSSPREKHAKITELEGLRGVLAWWVVLSHLLGISGYFDRDLSGLPRLVAKGSEAVDGFIILSGFVIFLLLDKSRDSYRIFLFRRFLRLYPVYVVCFFAAVLLAPVELRLLAALPWRAHPQIQGHLQGVQESLAYFWPHIAAHLTMLHGLLPNEVLPNSVAAFLGPAWSISLEWQFYLVAPLLLWCVRAGDWRILALCGLVLATSILRPIFGIYSTPGTLASWPLPAFLPMKAKFFFCGIVSFYAFKFLKTSPRTQARMASLYLVLLVSFAMFCKSPALIIWFAVFGAFLCRFSGNETAVSRVVSWTLNLLPVQWLGRISYSTYLCHLLLIYGAAALLFHDGRAWTAPTFFVALTALVVPAVLLSSHVLYTLVEAPFIRASKRWTSPRHE